MRHREEADMAFELLGYGDAPMELGELATPFPTKLQTSSPPQPPREIQRLQTHLAKLEA